VAIAELAVSNVAGRRLAGLGLACGAA